MKRPILYIIAGPNGAGKTTFAIKFLPKYAKCPNFVNADLIAKGGHNIPNPDVRRRFLRSINNFFILYLPLVDSWYLFDNSAEKPDLIANMAGGKVYIGDHRLYDKIRGRKIE